jgi:hypothetical protein
VGGEGGGNESTRSAPLGAVVMTAEVQEARLDKSAGAGRMGKAAEHLVAAACVLSTRGELNVSTSMVDDEAWTSAGPVTASRRTSSRPRS